MSNSGGKLIAEREKVIEWLCTPKEIRTPETQKELEVELNISDGRIPKWKKEPDFLDAILQKAKEYARIAHTPEIIEKTAQIAKHGNQQAVTNYFKYIEQIAEIAEIVLPKKVSDILNDDTKKANRKSPPNRKQTKKRRKAKAKRHTSKVR